MIKQNKNILTVDDFNEYASENFNCFVEQLKDVNWATRKPREDEALTDNGYEVKFIWTSRAVRLIEDYKSRLCIVGYRHFPNDFIEIENSIYYVEV